MKTDDKMHPVIFHTTRTGDPIPRSQTKRHEGTERE
jgi:hypothetical protein